MKPSKKAFIVGICALATVLFGSPSTVKADHITPSIKPSSEIESRADKGYHLLQKMKEPPLENVIRVSQRGFGYINPGTEKQFLETIGLGPCIGVYVKDNETGLQALAHLDAGGYSGIRYGEQLNTFLAYLKNQDLTDGDFDEVLVIRSQQGDKEGLEEVTSALKMRGHKFTEVFSYNQSMRIIFDKNGNMYNVIPETIQNQFKSNADARIFGMETMMRDGIKNENDGRVIKKEWDPICSGIARSFHKVANGFGAYGVRILVKEDFDLKVLDELKQEGIIFELSECKPGKLISVAKHGYMASQDFKVVREVDDLVREINKMLLNK